MTTTIIPADLASVIADALELHGERMVEDSLNPANSEDLAAYSAGQRLVELAAELRSARSAQIVMEMPAWPALEAATCPGRRTGWLPGRGGSAAPTSAV